jgi:hypothetical protein
MGASCFPLKLSAPPNVPKLSIEELQAEESVLSPHHVDSKKESFMFLRYALTAALILGSAAPAFAAKGFWIVRGPDKKCVVVETEPMATETTITKVGKDVYVTREEAQSDLAVVCK